MLAKVGAVLIMTDSKEVIVDDKLVDMYVEQLHPDAVSAFSEMSGGIDDSLRAFVRRFLESQYSTTQPRSFNFEIDYSKSYKMLMNDLCAKDSDSLFSFGKSCMPGEEIEKAEKELGFSLPSSVKQYLNEVCGMNLGDTFLLGIHGREEATAVNLLAHTKHVQSEYKLPPGFFVVKIDYTKSDIMCLDLRINQNGDCPILGYDKDERQFFGCIATSFDLWFRRQMASYMSVVDV